MHDRLCLVCTNITELPGDLSVDGDLDLEGTQIAKLPENLSINGRLSLENTKITKLPDSLSIGRWLHLNAEKISNIAFRKAYGKNNPAIFAAYVNGEIQISVDLFLGSLKAFETMVNEGITQEYITATDAEKYKQAARECIKELEEMRSR